MIIRIMQMIITMAIIIVRDNNSNNKRERERKQSIQIFKFANRKCFNCFWRRHDVYWAIYNCFFTIWFCVKRFYFKDTFFRASYFISVWSEEKTNQLLRISGNWMRTDLLTNKQFSIKIFSGNLILLDSENRKLVWSNLSLKCVVLKALFWIINTLLTELFVWPQLIET